MSWIFESAGHDSKEFSLDVSNFDTSKVVDMSYMFRQLSIYSNRTKNRMIATKSTGTNIVKGELVE